MLSKEVSTFSDHAAAESPLTVHDRSILIFGCVGDANGWIK